MQCYLLVFNGLCKYQHCSTRFLPSEGLFKYLFDTFISSKPTEQLLTAHSGFSTVSQLPVYLVAATLRPETMYGQTNCWVRPDMQYAVFKTKDNEVFVCTERSARNMAYQGFTAQEGKLEVLLHVTGQVWARLKCTS